MKNQCKKQVKSRATKAVVILLLLGVLLVGGIIVEPVELGRRGVVVGMSLDKTDIGYKVAIQLVSVASGDAEGEASAYTVVEGEGKTVLEAMDVIAFRSSLLPSYGHCKVLFAGEETLLDLDGILLNFLRTDLLSQDTQIVVVEGKGSEALSAKVPLVDSSSVYVEQDNMLVSQTGGRDLVSLKDYCARLDGNLGAKLLPYAIKVPTQPTASASASGGDEEAYLFDLCNTVAFASDGTPRFYGKEVTLGLGLVNAKGGQITAYDEEGRFVTVKLLSVTKTRRYTRYAVEGTYRYQVSVVDGTIPYDTPAEQIESLVAREIDRMMETAYLLAKQDGVDIFAVAGRLNARYGTNLSLEEVEWRRNIKVVCR